jgi:ankyrin repeat protein
MSSYSGKIEVVKILVEYGANIHAHDDLAFRYSSRNGNIETVEYLIEKGSNIHADGDYAVKKSSKYGHIEVVKFLINSDLDYFVNNKIAKFIIIEHNLIEFYKKFNIK